MEGVGVGSYPGSLSTSHPHSPVIGCVSNQSLAAIITAIKTVNALHSGNIFYLLGCRGTRHCCISGKVLFTRAGAAFLGFPGTLPW